MVRALAEDPVTIGGRSVATRIARTLPPEVEARGDAAFNQEYPQLAVALGGAMPQLLLEQNAQKAYMGQTSSPGPLSRFQVQGL